MRSRRLLCTAAVALSIMIAQVQSADAGTGKIPPEYEGISLTQDFEKTVKYVNSLLDGKYKNAAYLFYALGQQYLLNNKHKEGKKYFIKLVEQGVSYGEDLPQLVFLSYNNLSYILLNEKDFPQALKYTDLAIGMIEGKKVSSPDNKFKSKPYYNKAEILFDQEKFDDSKVVYRKAFDISEEEASSTDWAQYASLFWGQDEKELATSIKILLRAERFYPNDPNIFFNRGRAYVFQKNYRPALEDFFLVTMVDDGRFPKSLIEETFKFIKGILSMKDDKDYFATYANGISAKNRKSYDEAQAELLKVIKMNSEATFACLCLGEIAKNGENYNDALSYFGKIYKYKPDLAYLQLEFAETYYYMKNDKFADYAKRCIELVPYGEMAGYAKKMLGIK